MRTKLTLTLVILALLATAGTANSEDLDSTAYLPLLASERAGDTELYLGYIEILNHCVVWDELLSCSEFEHAGGLDDWECRLALAWADLMCARIGAPIEGDGVVIP